jgi:hypothetical protein
VFLVFPIARDSSAQTATEATAKSIRMSLPWPADGLDLAPAPEVAAGQATAPLPDRGYFGKAFGGIWTGSGTGAVLGGGVSFYPAANNQHQITIDLSYLRVEGLNGFMGEGNYHYNFRLEGGENFTPYAGGGINIADIGSSTEAAVQIGGGFRRPIQNGREFFVEGHFAFFLGDPFILRAGVRF